MEKKAKVEVAKGIQNEVGTRIAKHNEPVNKKKGGVKIKKSAQRRMSIDKEIIDSLKNKNNSFKKKIDDEKKKNILVEIDKE